MLDLPHSCSGFFSCFGLKAGGLRQLLCHGLNDHLAYALDNLCRGVAWLEPVFVAAAPAELPVPTRTLKHSDSFSHHLLILGR